MNSNVWMDQSGWNLEGAPFSDCRDSLLAGTRQRGFEFVR